jgi:hypothetical protein
VAPIDWPESGVAISPNSRAQNAHKFRWSCGTRETDEDMHTVLEKLAPIARFCDQRAQRRKVLSHQCSRVLIARSFCAIRMSEIVARDCWFEGKSPSWRVICASFPDQGSGSGEAAAVGGLELRRQGYRRSSRRAGGGTKLPNSLKPKRLSLRSRAIWGV